MPDGHSGGQLPDASPQLPVDPDRPPFVPNVRTVRGRLDIIGVIAAGGALGALGRYGLALALPTRTGQFPWGTFCTNVTGSLILGALLALVAGRYAHSRYLRPFLGTGVIGAYTTFSTYTVEADLLVRDGHALLAIAYVLASLLVGLVAVWLGIQIGNTVCTWGRR
jgi:CrcB protein